MKGDRRCNIWQCIDQLIEFKSVMHSLSCCSDWEEENWDEGMTGRYKKVKNNAENHDDKNYLRIRFPRCQSLGEISLRIEEFYQFLFQYGVLRKTSPQFDRPGIGCPLLYVLGVKS